MTKRTINSIRIPLNSEEVRLAEAIASDRMAVTRAAGYQSARRDRTRSDYDIDLMGAKGEIAFSKAYALPKACWVSEGPDDGWDFEVGGARIDVKTGTCYASYMVFKDVHFPCDIGVFVRETGNPAVMEIVGWAHKAHFLNHREEVAFGSDRRPGLHVQHLRKPPSLWALLTHERFRED